MSALCKRSTETEEDDQMVYTKQGEHDRWLMQHVEALKMTGVTLVSQREDVGDNVEIINPLMSSAEST